MSELKPFDEFMDALVHCDTVKVILTGCGESTFETKPIYEGICALAYHRAQPANEPFTRDYVEEAPTADVVPVVHGEWELFDECSNAGVYCSICHKAVYRESAWYKNVHIKSKYCPNCGAKMDKEEHREYD